jgi:hypothetical protein
MKLFPCAKISSLRDSGRIGDVANTVSVPSCLGGVSGHRLVLALR